MPPSGKPNTGKPSQPAPKSKLAAKYGAKLTQAVQAHSDDDTDYGFIQLPPGINNGVARLKRCYFDVYKSGPNAGQFYLRAVGVVLEPEEVMTNGGLMKTKSLFTSIMEPVCETKKSNGEIITQEQHVATILNHFRMLGGEEFTQGATGDDLESLAEALELAKPIFKFTTSPKFAQKDEGQVKKGDVTGAWENWHGIKGLEDYVPPEEEGFDEDPVPTATEATAPLAKPTVPKKPTPAAPAPTPTPSAPKGPNKPAKPVATKAPEPEPEPEPADDGWDDDTLNGLADEAASDSDSSVESGNQLTAYAISLGVPEKKVKDSNTWTSVVKMIQAALGRTAEEPGDGDDGSGEGGDAEPEGWKKGDECLFCPIDPKTKKPVKTPVKCKVISVNEESQVATLQAGKASYKDVPLSDLEVPS